MVGYAAMLPTGAVSWEATSHAGRFVRHLDSSARLDPVTSGGGTRLKLDATWTVVNGLASPARYPFRTGGGLFLRHRDYRLRVAVATSPTGPFRDALSRPLVQCGQSGAAGRSTRWWSPTTTAAVPAGNGTNRKTAIDAVRFNADGTIAPVVPTR